MMIPASFHYRHWQLLGIILLSLLIPTLHAEPFQAGLNAVDREHYATAYRAWKGLAEDGASEAQNNIGYLYERGYGVKQSYTRAIEWYKKAADQNSPEAFQITQTFKFVRPGFRQARLGVPCDMETWTDDAS